MAFIPGNSGTASTFPDGFQIANGTVTAPTLKFADSQTGWYRPGLNQVALASAGVQTWLVDASGNHTVGVDGATLHTVTGVEFRRIAGNATANVTKSFYTGIGAGTLRATLGVAGATNGIVTGTIAGDFAINAATGNIVIGAAGSSIASATSAGAWTFGPASNSALTHTVNGAAIVQLNHNGAARIDLQNNGNGSNLAVDTQISTIQFSGRFNSGVNDLAGIRGYYRGNGTTRSGSLDFYTYNAGSVVNAGSVALDGAWTLGILTGSAITHNLYGGATNSGLSDVLRLTQLGTGPTLTGLLFSGRNTSGGIADYARVANTIEDSTAGTHSGGLKFYTALSGSVTEKGSVTSAGAWTLGPSGFTGTQTFRGQVQIENTTTHPTTFVAATCKKYSASITSTTSVIDTNIPFTTPALYNLNWYYVSNIGNGGGIAQFGYLAVLGSMTIKGTTSDSSGSIAFSNNGGIVRITLTAPAGSTAGTWYVITTGLFV